MRKSSKKGFTIVELVIVIAVIAILAAVLIPTFISLTKKANQSADIQAVRQMNTQLAIAETEGKPTTVGGAVKALSKASINLDNYTSLMAGTQFYWVKSENRVIYVDTATDEVLYPEEYKDLDHIAGDWLCLNGDIEFKDYTVSGSTVTIEEPGQFAKFVDDFNNGRADATSVKTITLSKDIDLAGATAKFVAENGNGKTGFTGTLTIDGNSRTIYGYRDDTNTLFGDGELSDKGYGYGLFGNIAASGNVTIKDITFDGVQIEETKAESSGIAGVIAGYINGNVTLENVTIKNCNISAGNKVGAVAGTVSGTLTMNSVKCENVTITGSYELAKAVGVVNEHGTLTVSNCDFTGVEVHSQAETFLSTAFSVVDGKSFTIAEFKNNQFTVYASAWIYPCATEDLAWYAMQDSNGTVYQKSDRTDSLEYQGKKHNVHLYSFSTSNNITNGVPTK